MTTSIINTFKPCMKLYACKNSHISYLLHKSVDFVINISEPAGCFDVNSSLGELRNMFRTALGCDLCNIYCSVVSMSYFMICSVCSTNVYLDVWKIYREQFAIVKILTFRTSWKVRIISLRILFLHNYLCNTLGTRFLPVE